MQNFKIFSGTANQPLAEKIASGVGIKLGIVEVHKFSNNETRVRVVDEVAGETCFFFQSLSTPTDENWVETLFFIDALKRNSAKQIIGILPWIGYQKQDKAFRSGEAVSIAVVIKTLEYIGVDKIITFDLHSKQILNYFKNKPVVLSAFPLFLEEIKKMRKLVQHDVGHVMVAPDEGAYWAKDFAKKLGIGFVQMDKTRDRVTAKVSEKLTIHGDVKGKTAIIIDDCIYTGATLIINAKFLKQNGAKKVICFVTHPILSGDAPFLLQKSEIDSLIVTDTIFIPPEKKFPKLKVISVAQLIINTLNEMHVHTSKGIFTCHPDK